MNQFDLLIIPGSKQTIKDKLFLDESGLLKKIQYIKLTKNSSFKIREIDFYENGNKSISKNLMDCHPLLYLVSNTSQVWQLLTLQIHVHQPCYVLLLLFLTWLLIRFIIIYYPSCINYYTLVITYCYSYDYYSDSCYHGSAYSHSSS